MGLWRWNSLPRRRVVVASRRRESSLDFAPDAEPRPRALVGVLVVIIRYHANEEETGVTIQQNTDRIQTTHIGSLPRPHGLLDLMKAKFTGKPYDQKTYDATIAEAVADCVRKQVECGIDIVTDGEFSKPGFFTYIQERLEGFEARPNQKVKLFQKE